MSGPTPTVSPELKALMRRLRLGRLLDTLPERLALARSHDLTRAQFLEQLFSDEVQRRDTDSAGLRARAAKLDPTMVLEAWDDTAKITYDHAIWAELVSMRFVDQARNAFILGPVGVGKTFLATALGRIACRRRIGVHFERADKMHKRLKAARLDASYDAEMRKLIGVDLLLIDDYAPQPLDATETADIYRDLRRTPSPGGHRAHLEPGPQRMASRHGRPAPSPIRRRPAQKRRLGARHRRRVLPPTRKTHPHRSDRAAAHTSPTPDLTPSTGRRDHHASRSKRTRSGPMLLATRWSLKAGKRHWGSLLQRPHHLGSLAGY